MRDGNPVAWFFRYMRYLKTTTKEKGNKGKHRNSSTYSLKEGSISGNRMDAENAGIENYWESVASPLSMTNHQD